MAVSDSNVFTIDIQSEALPTWRIGMAVNEWRSISGSGIDLLIPADTGNNTTANVHNRVVDWVGFAYDPDTDTMYNLANGGHLDYSGNQVDSIRLRDAAPAWVNRCAMSAAGTHTQDTAYYPDGKPTSCHTYWSPVWVNGSAFRIGAHAAYGTAPTYNVIDRFDPATNAWDAQGTWSAAPAMAQSSGCCAHPTTGEVFLFGATRIYKRSFGGTWSNMTTLPHSRTYAATAVDTLRNKIMALGSYSSGARPAIYDIATNVYSTITVAGLPTAVSPNLTYAGLVYCPQTDRYYLQIGDGKTYVVTPEAPYACSELTATGDALPTGDRSARVCASIHYSSFLGGLVYQPSVYPSNVYFLRLH